MSGGNGLPNGWVEVRIEDILTPQSNGKVFQHGWSPQCEKHPSPSLDVWGVLKTTAIQAGAFLDEHNKELPAKLSARPHLEVREGDMLITCAGPRVRCGVPAFVRTSRPRLIISGKMYRFRGHPDLVEPRFLEAFLLSTDAQAAIDAMKTGISDSGLNLTHDRFAELIVKLAPLSEQTRIADRIDELFTDLAAGVAALERVRTKLKRYRSAVLHAAVTGRLTEAWRQEHGPPAESGEELLKRLLVERRRQWEQRTLADYQAKGKQPPKNWRERYQEPLKPKTHELPELPEGWCWAIIDQLIREPLRNGHSAKESKSGEGVRTLILSAITYGEFSERNVKSTVADSQKVDDLWLKAGDIFMERANTPELVGISRLFPGPDDFAIFPDLLIRIRTLKSVSPEFTEVALLAPTTRRYFQQSAQGTAGSMPKIDQPTISRCCIPLPPVLEQEAILERFAEKLSQIEAMETEVERGLARAARLRQAILKAAFEGKLVPQDLSDEPASVLLARIRALREAMAAQSSGRPKRASRKKAAPTQKVTKSAKQKSTKKKARKS